MRPRRNGWRTMRRRRIVPKPQEEPIWPLMMWILFFLGVMVVGAIFTR